MEKETRKLMRISLIISGVLSMVTIISFLGLLNIYLVPYQRIIICVIVASSALLLFIWVISLELARANRSGMEEGLDIYILEAGIGILLPVYIYLTGLFKGDKDDIRRIYININNLVVRHRLQNTPPSELLVLLPYCMQNKDCSCKITDDIGNCRRCGRCKIGEVSDLIEKLGIRAVVAKGGTAARNIVKECKPDFILAVACERELLSGMGDIGRIPVIGVINQRPNGYCTNTTVDILQLKKTLQGLFEKSCEEPGTQHEVKKGVKIQKNYRY